MSGTVTLAAVAATVAATFTLASSV
jgi:hypothetical protein